VIGLAYHQQVIAVILNNHQTTSVRFMKLELHIAKTSEWVSLKI